LNEAYVISLSGAKIVMNQKIYNHNVNKSLYIDVYQLNDFDFCSLVENGYEIVSHHLICARMYISL